MFPPRAPALKQWARLSSWAAVDRADEFRKMAEKAERLATDAATDIERTSYWRIAQSWRDLEAQAKRDKKRGM